MSGHPARIVCLNAETTETLCLLGEGHRIVGYAGPAARLPQTEQRKPRVSINGSNGVQRICDLNPDLVLGTASAHGSALGALAQHGIAVHLFNQSTVPGILGMIRTVGGMVGRDEAAAAMAASIEWRIEALRARSADDHRPCIYLEEWDEPSITAGPWVSELIAIAGGTDCFADVASRPHREHRIVEAGAVAQRAPDIIIGSWLGRVFRPDKIAARAEWRHTPAVANNELHEIAAAKLLPGPVALTEGLEDLHRIVETWRERRSRVFRTVFVPARTDPVSGTVRASDQHAAA